MRGCHHPVGGALFPAAEEQHGATPQLEYSIVGSVQDAVGEVEAFALRRFAVLQKAVDAPR